MSTIAERARMEADEAEREDEDEVEAEDEDGPQPEEPEAEPESAAADLPSFDPAALEAEQKRHDKALAKVFGSLDGFDGCDSCGGLGIIPKGLEPEPALVANADLVTCSKCNGHGILLTGSRHPQYQSEPCTQCNGHGYQDRAAVEAAERAAAYVPPPAAIPPPPAPLWDAARGVYVDHLGQPLGGTVTPYGTNG